MFDTWKASPETERFVGEHKAGPHHKISSASPTPPLLPGASKPEEAFGSGVGVWSQGSQGQDETEAGMSRSSATGIQFPRESGAVFI